MKTPRNQYRWTAWLPAALLAMAAPFAPAGVPQPGITLFGLVTDVNTGLPVTNGTLRITYAIPGGKAVTVETQLAAGDGFNYLVQIPLESAAPGSPVSANALELPASSVTYSRIFNFEGNEALSESVTLTPEEHRGRIEQKDLAVDLLEPPVGENRPPAILQVNPESAEIAVGETIEIEVTASDGDNDPLTFSTIPDGAAEQVSVNQVGGTANAVFSFAGTNENVGENTIQFVVSDGEAEDASAATVTVSRGGIDELIVSQGFGGRTAVNIRSFDPNAGPPAAILRSFSGIPDRFEEQVGGGAGRATYVSAGDVNNDGTPDVVLSFGPIVEEAVFPNLIVPRDGTTREVVGHSFSAFPTGEDSSVNYSGGETRTAVGDFIGSPTKQIAIAQGHGGSGVIRIFQYTGLPAPNGWEAVGQFDGLPAGAQAANASGGLTLAAGDLDGDGLDEILAAQTNSGTSQTIFHALDIAPNGTIAKRTPFAGFQPRFRGDGGIEMAVADLNGDGTREIVIASAGNSRTHGDNRDTAPLNLITIVSPVLTDGVLAGFSRPARSVLNVFDEATNPSGAVSVSAMELNGETGDGQELIVGTGAIIDVDGLSVTARLTATEPRYRLMKIDFDGAAVNGVQNVIGGNRGLNAFIGDFVPSSGAVFLGAANTD